jgi:hypothetical protein
MALTVSPAGPGTYLWDGLAGTNIEDLSRQLTFQALVEPAR